MVTTATDVDALAQACAERIWSEDRASHALGMSLDHVGAGVATVCMVVRRDMVNGYGTCHGGVISMLADTAFAFACNSRGTITVAAGFDISFLEPAHVDDVLVAEAHEVFLRMRSGIYDVTVRCGDTTIADFRGRSRSLGRAILRNQR